VKDEGWFNGIRTVAILAIASAIGFSSAASSALRGSSSADFTLNSRGSGQPARFQGQVGGADFYPKISPPLHDRGAQFPARLGAYEQKNA